MIYSDQTDDFMKFKRAGIIPMQARKLSYDLRYDVNTRDVILWRVNIKRPRSFFLYEKAIAILTEKNEVLPYSRIP